MYSCEYLDIVLQKRFLCSLQRSLLCFFCVLIYLVKFKIFRRVSLKNRNHRWGEAEILLTCIFAVRITKYFD